MDVGVVMVCGGVNLQLTLFPIDFYIKTRPQNQKKNDRTTAFLSSKKKYFQKFLNFCKAKKNCDYSANVCKFLSSGTGASVGQLVGQLVHGKFVKFK